MDEENREYVRIQDFIPFEFQRVKQEEYLQWKGKLREKRGDLFYLSEAWIREEKEFGSWEGGEERIHQLLVDMKNKLNFIILHLLKPEEEKNQTPPVHEVNMSGNGIGFETKQELIIGNFLEVKVILPLFPPRTILAHAEVMHTEKTSREGQRFFQIGAMFLDLSEEDQNRIIDYTFKTQRKKLRLKKAEEKEEFENPSSKVSLSP